MHPPLPPARPTSPTLTREPLIRRRVNSLLYQNSYISAQTRAMRSASAGLTALMSFFSFK